jgi:sugar-specific transcriptional regulator TrmB
MKRLQDLGLTEYQSRVYLTLLDLGAATASQIPTLSRVPRTRIYITMAQLHEKGLVNIIPEKPLKYEPVPIAEYLTKKAVELRQGAKDIEKNIETFSSEFSVIGEVEPDQKGRFEAIYGRRNFRDRLMDMSHSAKKEVVLVCTPKSPLRLTNAMIPVLEDKKKEKVRLRIIFPVTKENTEKAKLLAKYADVKHTDFDPLVDWAIVDGKELLVTHSIPDDDNPYRGDDVSIWTDDTAIVSSRNSLADEIWDNGIDPFKFDPNEVMLKTAFQWTKLKDLKLDKGAIAKSMSDSIGHQIAKRLKAKNEKDLVEGLAKIWKKSNIGDIHIGKKKPMTIVVKNNFDCQNKPDVGKPTCLFSEFVIKTILDEKLGEGHKVKVIKCVGIGDKECEFQITAK